MPKIAPVAFPLHPIVQTEAGPRCGCGADACTRIGKHPAVKWSAVTVDAAAPKPAPGAGLGLRTGAAPAGSGFFVVDLDGDEAVDWWLAQPGTDDDTYQVVTPRGLHLYFEHPNFPIPNSAGELAPGVDVRGDGGFVVAAGSPHRSGGRYEAVDPQAPIAEAPEWLLTWLRARAATTAEVQPYEGDVTDPTVRADRKARYAAEVATMPPSVEGQGGDLALYRAVQLGAYDYQLPVEDVLDVIRTQFDPRCVPSWGPELDRLVRHKSHRAKTASTRPRRDVDLVVPDDVGATLRATPAAAAPGTPAPTATGKGRFTVVGPADLATPVAPVRYLLRHFGIAPGRPTLLAGYGGAGKTIAVQDLALRMAAGLPDVWGLPVQPGGVLHVDYEMTLDPIKRRYQRLARAHGIDLAAADLGVVSMPQVYLSDPEAEAVLGAHCSGRVLCIIDNLAAATSTTPTKENESAIRRYLDVLTRVSAATGCTFLVLVHERKAGKDDPGGLQRVRGSSAITDASGSVVSISPGEKPGTIVVTQTKTSHRGAGEPLVLAIEDVWPDGVEPDDLDAEDAPGLHMVRVDATPAAVAYDDLERRIVALVRERPVETKDKLVDLLKAGRSRTYAALGALEMRREVVRLPGVGIVADNATARRARIVAACEGRPSYPSDAAVAKAANVDEVEVATAREAGAVYRDAGGVWGVVPQ